jgi:hypothetical protein
LFHVGVKLIPTLKLSEFRNILGTVGEKTIIVQIYSAEEGSPRTKQRLDNIIEWEASTVAPRAYDPLSNIFHLDSDYLAKTGLATQKLVLYCRPAFHQQFIFLQERVIDEKVFGWILGPPGTGKSTTALAFASTLGRKDWIVTWIHLSRNKYPLCVRFESDSKKSRKMHSGNIEELFYVLEEVDVLKHHIVFIDGFVLSGVNHVEIQHACYSWLEKDRKKRRLVVVCSMSSLYKALKEEDDMMEIEQFSVSSWKEEEYLDAVKNDNFFNNVKNVLDANLNIKSSREDLVRSKLYYAGASARWMFHLPTKAVIGKTDESVSAVTDILPYIYGNIGDRSVNVVNRLLSSSITKYVGMSARARKTSIISQFAAVMLAIQAGPELIRRLAEATHQHGNPSMDYWMFEMWFFASLCNGGVEVLDEHGGTIDKWLESNVTILDVNSFPALPDDNGAWFKPGKWNQGGYDAIYMNKGKGLVKLVQVASGDTHSFKIECFHKFLDSLAESSQSFKVMTLEIVFLVDQSKILAFKLAKTTGQGLLKPFGWEKGKEHDRVTIAGIVGWRV